MVYKRKNIPGDKRGLYAKGRPRIFDERVRLEVLLSREEREIVMRAALEAGMSASAFVRKLVLKALGREP